MDFGIAGVAAITVIAYIVGLAARVSPLDNKWIPILCGTAGADGAVGGELGVGGSTSSLGVR